MRQIIRFLSGAILGGILGGTVAILLAPASGAELRERVFVNVEKIREEVGQAARARRAELEEKLTQLRQRQE